MWHPGSETEAMKAQLQGREPGRLRPPYTLIVCLSEAHALAAGFGAGPSGTYLDASRTVEAWWPARGLNAMCGRRYILVVVSAGVKYLKGWGDFEREMLPVILTPTTGKVVRL